MRRFRSHVSIVVAAVALNGTTLRIARADDAPTTMANVEEGRRLFREAVEREDAGDYDGAVLLYRQALAHAVSPQLLFNIASCEEKLDRLLDAASTFQKAEQEAQASGNEEVAKEVRVRLEALQKITPRFFVRLPAGMEGTEVLLDGVPRFTSSEPVLVDPGDHHFLARAPDGAAFEVVVAVRRGDVRTVDVVFPTSTAGRAPASAPPPEAGPQPATRPTIVPIVITGGATLALTTAAIVTFAAGRAKKSRYVELNDTPTRENEAERIELASAGRSLYAATTVLAITAAAAGAATVYFVVRSLTSRRPPPRVATMPPRWIMPTAHGVDVGIVF